MQVSNEKQVFNLMDTNGRRNDVINALQGYLSILNDLNEPWDCLPNSLSQYLFYKKAIELSPDVFSIHGPYDALQRELNVHLPFRTALESNDVIWIQAHQNTYKDLISKFDKGIEDRARHYTSNLVKLGFVSPYRKISPVGRLLLGQIKLNKDELEHFLPIDDVNIIYLRQLLKLRVYDHQGKKFYSPFLFAIYLLLKNERISENKFCEMVQGLSPYFNFEEIDTFIKDYQEGDIVKDIAIDIPAEIDNSAISEIIFKKYFKNQKSSTTIGVYFQFYNLLYTFHIKRNQSSLTPLLQYYKENKSKLNKAFGCGKSFFEFKNSQIPSVSEFLENNKKIFISELNKYLYTKHELSKRLDQIKEYSDTTKRIFRATGIISFENGYVELAYKELCRCILKEGAVYQNIGGATNGYAVYEMEDESYFSSITSLSEILLYSPKDILEIINSIKEEFDLSDVLEITQKIADKRKKEFTEFVNKKYPFDKVKELLYMFNNRHNDGTIKDYVSADATIPTIYEFIVGIAWYYFSGKRIDMLSSYNLTLSADFEPLVHAGGGRGDIVIYDKNKVVMLEATLMNANSQKRGEWEPVLRHSVNLKVAEELKSTQRQVTTFFVADEFDINTINIWKAVAAVPMQSTIDRSRFTDNVVIMPLNSVELANLMDRSDRYDEIIDNIHSLFEVEKNSFNLNWRKDFINKLL